MQRHIIKMALVLILATCTISLYGQQTQPPAQGAPFEGKNLKIFPKDTTRQRLMGAMQSFNRSLGVKCDYCHVDDKSSDEKPEKNIARNMMKMLTSLHQSGKDYFPGDGAAKVTCWTCHRGSAKIELPAPPAPPQGQGGGGGQKPPQS